MERVREICRRIGITPVFVERPFARALFEAQTGEIDCIVSVFKFAEREKYLYFPSIKSFSDEMVVFVYEASGLKPQSLEDLKGHRVGAMRG